MLSVVIPALNSEGTLDATLSSILSNNYSRQDFEVIVVDNGSTDRTPEIVKKFPVELYHCGVRGQAPALNRGIDNSKGDIICITASDVIVDKNWLTETFEFLKLHPECDGVGGPVLAPQFGCKTNIERLTGELFFEDQYFPNEVTESKYGEIRASLYSTNCAYRKKAVCSAGGFDETLSDFMDIDICWRLLAKGSKLYFNPKMRVVHIGFPSTLTGVARQQFKWGKATATFVKRYKPSALYNISWLVVYFYSFTKCFLYLLSPFAYPKAKHLLRFFHLVTFNIGWLSGLRPRKVYSRT